MSPVRSLFMALSWSQIGVMLGAVLLLSQALAMEPESKRQEQQQEMCLIDLPPEIVLEVVANRRNDPKAMFRLASTCKKAYDIVKSELLIDRARRLFCPKTPITEVPHLIRDFSQNMDDIPDLRQIAASLKPVQVVRLFDRLAHVTDYSELIEGDETPFKDEDLSEGEKLSTMEHVSNPDAIFEQEQVVEMIISLTKAVNRPEITSMTSVFLSPDRCLTKLVSHLDPFPMPTNIPASIMEYIETELTEDLSRYSDPDLISSIHNLFPSGFKVFPENEEVAFNLIEEPALRDALLNDPEAIILGLLSVGIRFDCFGFLTSVPLSAESLPAIFPLLGGKSFGFHTVRDLWQQGKREHALTLLRTPDFRDLIVYYPERIASFVGNLIRIGDIDLIQVLVQEHFLIEIVNVPIDDGSLLLSLALRDVDAVEIAKLFMSVPGIDLYQLPIPSDGPICSPIQLLFNGEVAKQVSYRILSSHEFQNLIRCNPDAFRAFLQADERRLKWLQSLCPQFALEIMKDQNLPEQDILIRAEP